MTTGVMSPLKRVDCFTIMEIANSENTGENGKKGKRNIDTLPTHHRLFSQFYLNWISGTVAYVGVSKLRLAWINSKKRKSKWREKINSYLRNKLLQLEETLRIY
jgi:hypothetical protein